MRDESLHLAFGCDLINTVRAENPAIWTPAFKDEIVHLVERAVDLEKRYAVDACPNGLLGLNAGQFAAYVEYVADRRLERLTLPKRYQRENPFPWMSQATDLSKEKNFFETRVTGPRPAPRWPGTEPPLVSRASRLLSRGATARIQDSRTRHGPRGAFWRFGPAVRALGSAPVPGGSSARPG